MRVLVLAPNAGLSLSSGGGCNFTLKLAKFLLGQGHTVGLAGFHALSLPLLESLHGVELPDPEGRLTLHRAIESDRMYRWATGMPVHLSPYLGLRSRAYQRWIVRLLSSFHHDAIIFQDDVPMAAAPFLGEGPSYLYCHFPFRARSDRFFPAFSSRRPLLEVVSDTIVTRAIETTLLPDPGEQLTAIWANSTLTLHAIEAVWPKARPRYLPAYVEMPSETPREAATGRHTQVVALGAIQKTKNYAALIRSFSRIEAGSPVRRLLVVGTVRDPIEARRLRRLVARDELKGRARIVTGADHRAVRSYLANSAVIVHPAMVEPFGLALLEGMAFGCAAVSYQGEQAGGWIDILDRGRFGMGFTSERELSSCLETLFTQETLLRHQSELAVRRAQEFSMERFAHSLEGYFK